MDYNMGSLSKQIKIPPPVAGNEHVKAESNRKNLSHWETPDFLKIKMKRSKWLITCSQNEIWDREELLTVINYELLCCITQIFLIF